MALEEGFGNAVPPPGERLPGPSVLVFMRRVPLIPALLLATACGSDGDDGGVGPPPTGALEITTITPSNPPAAGYAVTVDGSTATPIGANTTLTVEEIEAGSHTVHLDVPAGCTVEGDNPRIATVPAGAAIAVVFNVGCAPSASTPPIVFTSLGDVPSDIYAVNPDGTGLIRLSPEFSQDRDAQWSPDGTRLLFLAADGLYLMNPDGSGRTRLTDDLSVSKARWSPHGGSIAFLTQRFEGNLLFQDLWVSRVDSRSTTMIAPNALDLSWSPDGQELAFVSESVESLELHVIGADGSGERTLTDPSLFVFEVAWSPDGSRIAFSTAGTIFTISPAGDDLLRLSFGETSDNAPVWSPDGSLLAFTAYPDGQSPDGEIGVMNPDGSGRRILTSHPGVDETPEWSPDGTQIAFRRSEAGRIGGGEIYVMNADGSGLINVSNRPDAHDHAPDWGP
jgi:Tol biopolymer transport system component